MVKASTFLFSLTSAAVFFVVLFADLLPLPAGGYAVQRFLQVGLLAVACASAAAMLMRRKGIGVVKQLWPSLLVASSFIILAVPFGNSPFAWVEPGLYAAFFFGFVAIGSIPGTDDEKRQWVVILVYSAVFFGGLYGAATLMVYFFALSDQVSRLDAFIPWGFVNIRYWGHIATWSIPLMALAALVGPLSDQRMWRFLCGVTGALWWWIVFVSTARGTTLGLAFGVVVAFICVGRPALPWLKTFFRYLAFGVCAWLILSIIVPNLVLDEMTVRSVYTGSDGRLPLFSEAWRMSLQNFPLGMGPQAWITHETLTEEYLKSKKYGHPHNMYLMWAAEYGWLMVCILLVLVVHAIRLFFGRISLNRDELNGNGTAMAAFTASVSAALFHAGVSSVFIAPGSMLVGFMVLCVFWSLISPNEFTFTKSGSDTKFAASTAFILIGFLAFMWLREVVIYYEAMVEDRNYYFETQPYGTPPRFWHYGLFPRPPSQMIRDGSGSSSD
ncbi:O-antigen ligase family protein [Marinobacter adhaerens]|jgi:O-antigen ligase|uniref:O-antigen ligase family protein n=1 Tax=Marinobacter adhaerens TaxID=1033846 RepID=UPI003BAAE7DB